MDALTKKERELIQEIAEQLSAALGEDWLVDITVEPIEPHCDCPECMPRSIH